MAKTSIDTVKRYVEYLVRKNTSGTLTPAQFNLIINRASRNEFVNRVGNPHQYAPGKPIPQMGFQITQKITEDVKVFQTNANLILNAQGRANYPADLAYTIDGLGYKSQKSGKAVFIPIETIDKEKEYYRMSSSIVAPDKSNPIAIFENTYLQVHPINISNISFPYLRYPKDAVWAFTLVNNRPVFDPANSVDLEWEDLVVNDIIMKALQSIGISIKDAEVLSFANQKTIEGA
jgi:hypothetical protein